MTAQGCYLNNGSRQAILAGMHEIPGTVRDIAVGELAARSGVSTSALRFYERQGLIASSRTSGNQRRYTRDTLRRVSFIRVSQRVGIPLSMIREALSILPHGRTPTRTDWEKLSTYWRSELDARIQEMTTLRDSLTDCIGCGCLSLDRCKLANPDDRLGLQGPGPRRLMDPDLLALDVDPAAPDDAAPAAKEPAEL